MGGAEANTGGRLRAAIPLAGVRSVSSVFRRPRGGPQGDQTPNGRGNGAWGRRQPREAITGLRGVFMMVQWIEQPKIEVPKVLHIAVDKGQVMLTDIRALDTSGIRFRSSCGSRPRLSRQPLHLAPDGKLRSRW